MLFSILQIFDQSHFLPQTDRISHKLDKAKRGHKHENEALLVFGGPGSAQRSGARRSCLSKLRNWAICSGHGAETEGWRVQVSDSEVQVCTCMSLFFFLFTCSCA